jgi:hypothetical protein
MLCIAVSLSTLVTGCGRAQDDALRSASSNTYRNEEWGWQVDCSSDYAAYDEIALIGNGGRRATLVKFAEGGREPAWLGPGRVEILSGTLARATTLQKYVQQAPFFNRELRKMQRNAAAGVRIRIESPYRRTRFAGYPALTATYTLSVDGLAERTEVYELGSGKREYQITLAAEQDQWEFDRSDLLRFAQTFCLLE